MIDPKEKADEILRAYDNVVYRNKQGRSVKIQMGADTKLACAIISVSEIERALPKTVSAFGYGSAQFENPMIQYYNQILVELKSRL